MGLYQFKVLSFGLTNAPATFQAEMNRVLASVLGICCVVYLDDICIYSKTLSKHLAHMATIFALLRKEKFFANLKKCAFAVHELKFLGHIVGKDGIKVDPAKIEVIKKWPVPKTLSELNLFLA